NVAPHQTHTGCRCEPKASPRGGPATSGEGAGCAKRSPGNELLPRSLVGEPRVLEEQGRRGRHQLVGGRDVSGRKLELPTLVVENAHHGFFRPSGSGRPFELCSQELPCREKEARHLVPDDEKRTALALHLDEREERRQADVLDVATERRAKSG